MLYSARKWSEAESEKASKPPAIQNILSVGTMMLTSHKCVALLLFLIIAG